MVEQHRIRSSKCCVLISAQRTTRSLLPVVWFGTDHSGLHNVTSRVCQVDDSDSHRAVPIAPSLRRSECHSSVGSL